MQVWSIAFSLRISQLRHGVKESHWNAIAALIVICHGVQGLVQIADKVDQEAQRIRLFWGSASEERRIAN